MVFPRAQFLPVQLARQSRRQGGHNRPKHGRATPTSKRPCWWALCAQSARIASMVTEPKPSDEVGAELRRCAAIPLSYSGLGQPMERRPGDRGGELAGCVDREPPLAAPLDGVLGGQGSVPQRLRVSPIGRFHLRSFRTERASFAAPVERRLSTYSSSCGSVWVGGRARLVRQWHGRADETPPIRRPATRCSAPMRCGQCRDPSLQRNGELRLPSTGEPVSRVAVQASAASPAARQSCYLAHDWCRSRAVAVEASGPVHISRSARWPPGARRGWPMPHPPAGGAD